MADPTRRESWSENNLWFLENNRHHSERRVWRKFIPSVLWCLAESSQIYYHFPRRRKMYSSCKKEFPALERTFTKVKTIVESPNVPQKLFHCSELSHYPQWPSIVCRRWTMPGAGMRFRTLSAMFVCFALWAIIVLERRDCRCEEYVSSLLFLPSPRLHASYINMSSLDKFMARRWIIPTRGS